MDAFNPFPVAMLQWMESSWLSAVMLDWAWSWVIAETLHFTGMCLLFGPIIVMDLRLIGIGRSFVSLSAAHALIPVAVAGFVINLLTGIMFCFGNPFRYATNISFQIKMVLILLAGANALWYWRRSPLLHAGPATDDSAPPELRLIGLASLLLWTGVLGFGRMIPYLGTG